MCCISFDEDLLIVNLLETWDKLYKLMCLSRSKNIHCLSFQKKVWTNFYLSPEEIGLLTKQLQKGYLGETLNLLVSVKEA